MSRTCTWRVILAGALVVLAGCAHAPPAHPSAAAASPPAPSPQATWYPARRLPAANAAPHLAPYFVTLALQRRAAPAVVTDAFTGKKLAIVYPLVPGTRFAGAAAAGDDRTFVLAAQGTGPATRYYELRLRPGGRPRPLVLLPAPAIAYGDTLAVSPDGGKLAIVTSTAQNSPIEVVSLATGSVRQWTARGGYATDLSWAGDRFLAFQWWDGSRSARAARARSGVRLLDTAAAGSDLLHSRLIVGQSARTSLRNYTELSYPLISADGSRLFATVLWGGPSNPKAEVVEFSARTGRALAVVTPAAGESGMGSWCGVLWTDPSGARAITACAPDYAGGQELIGNGHFTRANLHAPIYNLSTPRDSFIAW